VTAPNECRGRNYHESVEVREVDAGAETEVVAYCDNCEQQITGTIDLRHASAWFEAKEVSQR